MIFFEPNEYQENVNKLFEQIRGEIFPLISYSRFEHIGASSIPGSVSKGDLDIFIGVERDEFVPTIKRLEGDGFEEKPDTLRTQELCMMITDKYDHDVALQVVVNGSEFEDFIVFRDYMRSRPDLVEELNQLRRACRGLEPQRYRKIKSEWVENIVEQFKGK